MASPPGGGAIVVCRPCRCGGGGGALVAKNAGRSTRRYRKLRLLFKQQCTDAQRPCWLCGQPIDYTLEYPHPESWSLDHRYTLESRIDLAEDPANFEASHLACNKNRGKGNAPSSLGDRSREW